MKSNLSNVTKMVTQEGHTTRHPAGDRVKIQAASFQRTNSRTLRNIVCLGGSIAVMKYHDQSKAGRQEFIWFALPGHSQALRGGRAGTQGRTMERRSALLL